MNSNEEYTTYFGIPVLVSPHVPPGAMFLVDKPVRQIITDNIDRFVVRFWFAQLRADLGASLREMVAAQEARWFGSVSS